MSTLASLMEAMHAAKEPVVPSPWDREIQPAKIAPQVWLETTEALFQNFHRIASFFGPGQYQTAEERLQFMSYEEYLEMLSDSTPDNPLRSIIDALPEIDQDFTPRVNPFSTTVNPSASRLAAKSVFSRHDNVNYEIHGPMPSKTFYNLDVGNQIHIVGDDITNKPEFIERFEARGISSDFNPEKPVVAVHYHTLNTVLSKVKTPLDIQDFMKNYETLYAICPNYLSYDKPPGSIFAYVSGRRTYTEVQIDYAKIAQCAKEAGYTVRHKVYSVGSHKVGKGTCWLLSFNVNREAGPDPVISPKTIEPVSVSTKPLTVSFNHPRPAYPSKMRGAGLSSLMFASKLDGVHFNFQAGPSGFVVFDKGDATIVCAGRYELMHGQVERLKVGASFVYVIVDYFRDKSPNQDFETRMRIHPPFKLPHCVRLHQFRLGSDPNALSGLEFDGCDGLVIQNCLDTYGNQAVAIKYELDFTVRIGAGHVVSPDIPGMDQLPVDGVPPRYMGFADVSWDGSQLSYVRARPDKTNATNVDELFMLAFIKHYNMEAIHMLLFADDTDKESVDLPTLLSRLDVNYRREETKPRPQVGRGEISAALRNLCPPYMSGASTGAYSATLKSVARYLGTSSAEVEEIIRYDPKLALHISSRGVAYVRASPQ